MEEKVGTLCLMKEKKWALAPNALLIQIMLSETLPDFLILIHGGGEELCQQWNL